MNSAICAASNYAAKTVVMIGWNVSPERGVVSLNGYRKGALP
ncbi:MAG: hypothetical protein QOF19_1158 [Alphaproteobacteria bacterium]|jgi:hypothetical protein|nr:hypothetical protein [Alphaproteobacteria bacterium]